MKKTDEQCLNQSGCVNVYFNSSKNGKEHITGLVEDEDNYNNWLRKDQLCYMGRLCYKEK